MMVPLLKFALDNIIRGFAFALAVAAAKFFIEGDHIGTAFYSWMAAGFILSLLLKTLDVIEIYNKLKEIRNES